MSVIAAMAKLLAQAPGAPFGSDEGATRRIWAPTILSTSPLPAFGLSRYEGLNIETFGSTEEQPRVQLMCRSDGTRHDEAEKLMQDAVAWLSDKHDVTLEVDVAGVPTTVVLGYVRSTSGIMWLGPNDASNHEWTTSFEVTYG